MFYTKGSTKIDTLPMEIQGRIDELLVLNTPINTIIRQIKEEFKLGLDWRTVARYKDIFLEEYNKREQTESVQEIVPDGSSEEEIKNVQIVSNKKDLLEKLIADSYQRLQDIRKMNKRRYDPKWESFISSYTENIRKIVETLSKLDETFENDNAKIDNIVKSHLSKIIKCVHETIKIVCPEKANEFKQVLSQKYKEETKQLENKNAEND